MYVLPTLDMAKRTWTQRIAPMFNEMPDLREKVKNREQWQYPADQGVSQRGADFYRGQFSHGPIKDCFDVSESLPKIYCKMFR